MRVNVGTDFSPKQRVYSRPHSDNINILVIKLVVNTFAGQQNAGHLRGMLYIIMTIFSEDLWK